MSADERTLEERAEEVLEHLRRDHLWWFHKAESVIREQQARIAELEEPTFCEECGKSIHDCDLDYWREKAEKSFADYAELRAERDSLRRDLESTQARLSNALSDSARFYNALQSARADAERYRWLRDAPWTEEIANAVYVRSNARWDSLIDAARARGEG